MTNLVRVTLTRADEQTCEHDVDVVPVDVALLRSTQTAANTLIEEVVLDVRLLAPEIHENRT